MMTSTFKKTVVAAAVAGTFAAGTIPPAEANVVNLSWRGAFTFLNQTGAPVENDSSDYVYGYYANGDGNGYSFGAPAYPGNVGPNATGPNPNGAYTTAFGWYGNRTPVSGTMSFDTNTGAGVGTINPFLFLVGDVSGTGPFTNTATISGLSFQAIDTAGTLVGTMLFNWNGSNLYISMVYDGSGFIANVATMIADGPTSTLSGVGTLPATDGINFDTSAAPLFLPLGPSPIATKTLNTGGGLACDGQTIANQLNPYTIVGVPAVIDACTTGMADDGIGGDPMTSPAFLNWNANFDFRTIQLDSFVSTPVPAPAAIWLFGSGLLGLIGLARRKRGNKAAPRM